MTKNTRFNISLLFLILPVIFLFPLCSFAESGGSPVKAVLVQLFNFALFATALLFFIRKPLAQFFHKRQKDFLFFEEQAKLLEKQKNQEEQKWDEKLKSLTLQEQNIKQKAEEEGKKFMLQKKTELKNLEARLQNSAEFLIRLEGDKAKQDILCKWKKKIAQKAKVNLETSTNSLEFQSHRLEGFLKQLEV